jgi:hypothetical protein
MDHDFFFIYDTEIAHKCLNNQYRFILIFKNIKDFLYNSIIHNARKKDTDKYLIIYGNVLNSYEFDARILAKSNERKEKMVVLVFISNSFFLLHSVIRLTLSIFTLSNHKKRKTFCEFLFNFFFVLCIYFFNYSNNKKTISFILIMINKDSLFYFFI